MKQLALLISIFIVLLTIVSWKHNFWVDRAVVANIYLPLDSTAVASLSASEQEQRVSKKWRTVTTLKPWELRRHEAQVLQLLSDTLWRMKSSFHTNSLKSMRRVRQYRRFCDASARRLFAVPAVQQALAYHPDSLIQLLHSSCDTLDYGRYKSSRLYWGIPDSIRAEIVAAYKTHRKR